MKARFSSMLAAYFILSSILCAYDPTENKKQDGPSIVNPDDIKLNVQRHCMTQRKEIWSFHSLCTREIFSYCQLHYPAMYDTFWMKKDISKTGEVSLST